MDITWARSFTVSFNILALILLSNPKGMMEACEMN